MWAGQGGVLEWIYTLMKLLKVIERLLFGFIVLYHFVWNWRVIVKDLYLVLCLMALLRYVIACKRALSGSLSNGFFLRYVICCKRALSGSLSNGSFKICYLL